VKFLDKEINVLDDKEAVIFTLVQHKNDFNSRKAWGLILKDLFPNGLMLMDGEKHKHHRSIISEAFKKEALEGYLGMMKKICFSSFGQLE